MSLAFWLSRSSIPISLTVFVFFGPTSFSFAISPAEEFVTERPALQLDPGWGSLSTKSLTTRSASYPTIISDHSCTEHTDSQRIYCFGGIDTVSTNAPETDLIVEYDPVGDTAVAKTAVLPSRRSGLACAEDSSSGLIYCFGGRAQDFECTLWDGDNCIGGTSTSYVYDDIVEYDATTDTVRLMSATLPSPNSGMACTEDGSSHRIYCFGGTSSSSSASIIAYDPATDSMAEQTATLPTGRSGLSCTEQSTTHDLFCFGGRDAGGKLNDIFTYDPSSDSLTARGAIFPSRITDLSCAEDPAAGRIYCFGGQIQSIAYVSEIYSYDPTSDQLTVMPETLPTGRYGLSCVDSAATDTIFCSGGSRNVVSIDEIVEFTPSSAGSPICPDRDDDYYFDAACGGTDCDDDPARCGGFCYPGKLEDCDGYDNDCNGSIDEGLTCDVIPVASATLPWEATRLTCATTSDRRVFCFGGGDDENEIVEYDPASDLVVTRNETLPDGRFGIACAADTSTDRIYCLGGGTSATSVLEYDPATDDFTTTSSNVPSARNRLACVENSATHRIYCLGGMVSQSVVFADILEYDPATDTLTTMSEVLPGARSVLACAEDSSTNKIYCFGGYRWGGPPYFREIVEYDPATHEVATMSATLPYPGQEGMGCAEDSLHHQIYCFGGYNHMVSANDEIDYFDHILKYDPASDTQTTESLRLPTRRAFLPCAEDPATHLIYCFGGQSYPGSWVTYDEITVFTPFGVVPPNSRPVANDDAFSTPEDTPFDAPSPGVLGNDNDTDGDQLTAIVVNGPDHGTAVLEPDGSFSYGPAADYSGADTFSYVANDGGQSSTVTLVNIEVTPVNDSPVAVVDRYFTPVDTPRNEPAPGVLDNDSDADGDSLTATLVGLPQHGTVDLDPDGGFVYTPTAGFSGNDGFSYRAEDATSHSAETVVSLSVGNLVFADGFELGDTSLWSASVSGDPP
ncbi:MAG: Ig-like domain-containing protein [Acidobacteriota bacterium]|nr:Ig-like domain-containing protein [Acidobacteriota bacterium]